MRSFRIWKSNTRESFALKSLWLDQYKKNNKEDSLGVIKTRFKSRSIKRGRRKEKKRIN